MRWWIAFALLAACGGGEPAPGAGADASTATDVSVSTLDATVPDGMPGGPPSDTGGGTDAAEAPPGPADTVTATDVEEPPPDMGALPAVLAINEIVCKSHDGGPDWVELTAVGGSVSLGGWTLVDDSAEHAPAQLPNVSLSPGEYLVLLASGADPGDGSPWLPFKLGSSDALTLRQADTVIDTLAWSGDAPAGTSFGRLPDGTGAPTSLTPTPGAPNQPLTKAPPASPFISDRVVPVEVVFAPEDWAAILAAPLDEEYHPATLIFDGLAVANVAVRTKGNSSLKSVASMGSHRLSFKVDTNRNVPGQTLLGVKKLNLNNGFKDPTLLREHLAYALMREAGVPAPRTTFVDLTVGGEHLGLYLMVEHVDDDFLAQHFPASDGTLYKPEPPAGNLTLMGPDPSAYPGIEVEQNEETDHAAFLALVTALDGGDQAAISAALDVDGALLQLAFHTLLTNLDSYLGPGHNYYLYESEGRIVTIPWDTNEAFGTFTCGCDRAGLIGLRIDEPTCGALADKPLVHKLLQVPAWRDQYHAHLRALVEGSFSPDAMAARIEASAALIRPAVAASPVLFYTQAEFEQGLASDVQKGPSLSIGLQAFVAERGAAVLSQLDGQTPSTANGAGSCKAAGGGPKPCGDGVCDPFEKANPQICPQDCT